MSNKDLFKQAIAEAKTIREAAITNAKEALEESLTPHLKEMLAQKLQEMEDAEDMEEIVNEEDMMDDGKDPYAKVMEAEEEEEGEEQEAEEGEEQEAEEGEEETEEEDLDLENMSVEEFKDLVRDIIAQEVGSDQEEIPGEEAPEGEEDMVGMDSEEEIDINELLAELAEMEHKEDTMDEGMESFEKWLDGVSAKLDKFGKSNPAVQAMDKAVAAAQAKAKELGVVGGGMNKGHKLEEKATDHQDLNEALSTIEVLRTQLQEVNLLNAKLLYVNKVFKANNLTESQKVNVVAAFDKAETVKEVKLVFETVSKNVVTKPAAIKEHRSFASKAAGTAATAGKKEIISEVSEQVARWQKLAGIIK